MKSILLLACALTFILSINVYAQTAKEINLSTSAISNFNAYQHLLMPLDKETNFFTFQALNKAELGHDVYTDSPMNKMGLGVINTATAWVDIPRQIAKVSEEHNIFAGITLGLGEGIVSGFARGISGTLDVATFGLPPYDKPMMEPQYKVDRPQEGFKVMLLEW